MIKNWSSVFNILDFMAAFRGRGREGPEEMQSAGGRAFGGRYGRPAGPNGPAKQAQAC